MNELDQIIKFHFTQSIFDIILISSFKALLVFISITELESASIRIALKTASLTDDSNLNSNPSDTENLINSEIEPSLSSIETLKSLKQFLHIFTIVVNLACVIYLSIKFGFVLNLIINDTKLPMHYFYFAALTTEFGLCLIELLFSCFSWRNMRTIGRIVHSQASLTESEQTEKKKVNIKRLIGLSYPERYHIAIAFVMLIISSFTNIVSPYFFGSVVDSAVNYTDLSKMNKYIIYLFVIYFWARLLAAFVLGYSK